MKIALFLLLIVVIPKSGMSQVLECDRYYIFDLRDSSINGDPVVVFKMYTDINTANAGTYTSLCFIDQNSDTLNPRPVYAYSTPVAGTPYDTLEYVLYYDNGFTSFPSDFHGILFMEVPACEIPYDHTVLSSTNVPMQDIGIRIFPNPSSSDLLVTIDHPSFSENDKISLFSLLGTELYSTTIDSQESKIDVSSYPAGLYLLRATVNGVSKTVKILKE